MSDRGRGRGRGGRGGRGRGRGGAEGPRANAKAGSQALARSKESKRKAEQEAESPEAKRERLAAEQEKRTALQLDEHGRVIANIAPQKRYPATAELTLMQAFMRDIEDGALVGRTTQTEQSAQPRRLLDHMKVNPVEKWKGSDAAFRAGWRLPPGPSENEQVKALFNEVMGALEQDMETLRQTTIPLEAQNTNEKANQTRRNLLFEIEHAVAKDKAPPIFWHHIDEDPELYTDSEDERDYRFQRFAPPVHTLRSLRKDLIRTEQQNMMMGRSMAIMKEEVAKHETEQKERLEKNLPELEFPAARAIAQVNADNAATAETRLHTEKGRKRREDRQRWREWVTASKVAQWQVAWAPHNDIVKLDAPKSAFALPPKETSFAHLYYTCVAKLFPNRLRSADLDRIALERDPHKDIMPNPYRWIIEDEWLMTEAQRSDAKVTPLKILPDDRTRLYLGNFYQMTGRPMGRTYARLHFAQDFKFWLMAIGELNPLRPILRMRPNSRALRALVSRRIYNTAGASKNTEVDESLISAIGSITGASAVGASHTQAATVMEQDDSDVSRSEDEYMREEADYLKRVCIKPESVNFASYGYGPENVLVRIGGGIGRLRNAYDVNRQRFMGVELLKGNTDAPVPMQVESSEDEDKMYINRHNQYRRRFRSHRARYDRSIEKSRAEEEAEAVTEWPGGALDRLKERRRKEAAEEALRIAQGRKKRRRDKEDGYDKSVKIAKQLGMMDEIWQGFNLKPRLRGMEIRLDRDKKSMVPLGFIASGENLAGREMQLVGIDEAELHRRFGLNKVFQQNLPYVDALKAHRRHFAAIIDEASGQVRLVKAAPTRLMLSDAPEEAMRDFMWDLYWTKTRTGVHDQHILRKALRYRNFLDNNAIVWREDLERYQKLREKANEVQSHRQIRYLKGRPGTYRHKKELDEMGNPNFDYEYADDPPYDPEAMTESDISAVDYQDLDQNVSDDGGDSDVPPASRVGIKAMRSELAKDKLCMGLEDAKAESRRVKKHAEDYERFSGFNKVKPHFMTSWNGTRTAFRRRLVARQRPLILETYFKDMRQFRDTYKKLRRDIAERNLYESAWVAAAVKRASAKQKEADDNVDDGESD